ncbi:MAG: glycoside hydrolase family 28 protein [Bacteroidetes bacterium]|nr:MAG: glycoside hydrolase family 28 protein [Bacteroidota bacterium]
MLNYPNGVNGENVRVFVLTGFLALTGIVCAPFQASVSQTGTFPTEAIAPVVVPFDMSQPKRPVIPSQQFSILEFGAKEGGTVKCTDAIQHAIDDAANAGGGTVVIPKGTWLTGAIHLESNINLHLAKDAVLLFSQDFNDYLPAVFSRHEDVECYKYSSFIYANGKENIAITGEGTLNGQGKLWWEWKKDTTGNEKELFAMAKNGVPVKERVFDGTNGRRLRPAFFQPMNCKNILVEGVTFLYGGFWTITPTYCENVIVRNIRIETEGAYGHTPNGDGVNPSSSRNVLIENCIFDTGDDCIAIKAGRDHDGLRVNKPTENIVVRNCKGLRGHGGIVIGSETSGSVRNIYAENCEFNGTDRIVRLKTARGRGGVLENMWFKNMSGENIQMEAIHLNMLYTGKRLPEQPVAPSTPRMRNIHFDNIKCLSGKSYAVELLGLPEMLIENISFNNISGNAEKGVHFSDVKGIEMKNTSFKAMKEPLLKIMNGSDITIDSMSVPESAQQFLKVEGEGSANIIFKNTPLPEAEKKISLGEGVSRQAVKLE